MKPYIAQQIHKAQHFPPENTSTFIAVELPGRSNADCINHYQRTRWNGQYKRPMVVKRAEHGGIAKVAAEEEAVRAKRREESNREKVKNAQEKEKKSARGTALKSARQFVEPFDATPGSPAGGFQAEEWRASAPSRISTLGGSNPNVGSAVRMTSLPQESTFGGRDKTTHTITAANLEHGAASTSNMHQAKKRRVENHDNEEELPSKKRSAGLRTTMKRHPKATIATDDIEIVKLKHADEEHEAARSRDGGVADANQLTDQAYRSQTLHLGTFKDGNHDPARSSDAQVASKQA